MEYNFKSKDELIKFLQEEIINTKEVTKILGCARQNLTALNTSGALVPIKKMSNDTLYLKSDVLARLNPSK